MARALYTSEAQKDLRGIYGYTVEKWGTAQAERYLGELRKKCELLADQPRLAPRFLSHSALRIALCREHRIFYLPVSEGVEILRVVHQAQDLTRVVGRIEALRDILRDSRHES